MQQEPPYMGSIGYNREPIIDENPLRENPYHGNLLLNAERALGSSRKALFKRLKFAIMHVIPPIEQEAG